jgi:hypothetical protein
MVFQCKSLLFAWFLVRLCDHAVCNPRADGETTSQRPAVPIGGGLPIHFHPKMEPGILSRDRLRHWVAHPLPLGPGSIVVGLPSLQTFEPRLASPDVSFYFLFTKATPTAL